MLTANSYRSNEYLFQRLVLILRDWKPRVPLSVLSQHETVAHATRPRLRVPTRVARAGANRHIRSVLLTGGVGHGMVWSEKCNFRWHGAATLVRCKIRKINKKGKRTKISAYYFNIYASNHKPTENFQTYVIARTFFECHSISWTL